MIQKYLIIFGLAALSFGSVFTLGYYKGSAVQIEKYQTKEKEIQNELLDLNEVLQVRNAEILRLQQEREVFVNELENQAILAEGANAPGVGTTGGLQRLERRWSSSTTSSN